MIGIYSFRNRFNQKRYIGKSIDIKKRYNAHMAACFNRNEDGYFYRALRKYGIENFDFEVLIELPWLEGADKKTIKKVLDYWETFYIKYYCAKNANYGYNLTNGGDGTSGIKRSDEWKEKQSILQKEVQLKYWTSEEGKKKAKHHSDVMIGRKQSEETKQKRIKSLKKIEHSKEWNKKISSGRKGMSFSDDHIKHLSESHLGKKPGNADKHKVWNDETHTKFHYE